MPLSRFHDTVYLLKRGGLKDTIYAISQLELAVVALHNIIPYDISSYGNNTNIIINNDLISNIKAANTIHVLLAGLSRYREWPEVESRACRIVAAFIAIEDDNTLIQRYIMDILSLIHI